MRRARRDEHVDKAWTTGREPGSGPPRFPRPGPFGIVPPFPPRPLRAVRGDGCDVAE